MYIVWVKIDDTLPWVELKGAFQTRREARRAAARSLNCAQTVVVNVPERSRHAKVTIAART